MRFGYVAGCFETDSTDSSWLITLSDLTLLLLCFLAVWYIKQRPQDVLTEKPKSETHVQAGSTGQKDASGTEEADWLALKNDIAKAVADAGMREDVEIQLMDEEIRLSFKESISFASGKAELNVRALPVLEKVAAVSIGEPKLRLRVEGHTDDRPISTPEFPSNWELSSARASRVARALIERGVSPSRIAVNGYANYRPRTSNDNRFGRGANRRVDISLMRQKTSRSQ